METRLLGNFSLSLIRSMCLVIFIAISGCVPIGMGVVVPILPLGVSLSDGSPGYTLYSPNKLKKFPKAEVIKLYNSGRIFVLKVDDVKVQRASSFVLSPGVHILKIREYGPTPEWAAITKSMESIGYTLNNPNGNSFSKYVDGKDRTLRITGVNNRLNVERKIKFCSEPGRVYSLVLYKESYIVIKHKLSYELTPEDTTPIADLSGDISQLRAEC